MKHASPRTVAAAVAVVAALGSLSACGGHSGNKASGNGGSGGSSTSAGPLAALRAAVTKTTQAQSAKISGTSTTGRMTTTMNGSLDWSSGTHAVIYGRMTGKNAASSIQLGSNGTMQIRYTPDALYMDMGPTVAKVDGGKPWVKYSYDQLAKRVGVSGAVLQNQAQNSDPTRAVQLLIASGDVTSLGSATVNGTQTTHYQGTLDVDKLLDNALGLGMDKATAQQYKAQLTSQGVTAEHIDLWVDDSGLLVKKVEKRTMKTGTTTSTVYYSDYGVTVSVMPPPAAQTVDFTQLMAAEQGK